MRLVREGEREQGRGAKGKQAARERQGESRQQKAGEEKKSLAARSRQILVRV